jgi:hypothetical protein
VPPSTVTDAIDEYLGGGSSPSAPKKAPPQTLAAKRSRLSPRDAAIAEYLGTEPSPQQGPPSPESPGFMESVRQRFMQSAGLAPATQEHTGYGVGPLVDIAAAPVRAYVGFREATRPLTPAEAEYGGKKNPYTGQPVDVIQEGTHVAAPFLFGGHLRDPWLRRIPKPVIQQPPSPARRPQLALPPHETPALPGRPEMLAIERGAIPQGPTAPIPQGPLYTPPPRGPIRLPSQSVMDEVRERMALRGSPKRPYEPAPAEVPGRMGPEGPVLDPQGRSAGPGTPPSMTERERLRALYKRRLDEPGASEGGGPPEPPSVPPRGPQKPPAGPTIPEERLKEVFGDLGMSPEDAASLGKWKGVARAEMTPEGMQAVIGDTPARAIPKTTIKAKAPQTALEKSPLFGLGREAREAAQAKAQGDILHDPQRAAVQEWLTDQIGSQGAFALSTSKSPMTIPAAVRAKMQQLGIDPKDAWDVSHAEVPSVGAMERLVSKSTGQEPKALPSSGEVGREIVAPMREAAEQYRHTMDRQTVENIEREASVQDLQGRMARRPFQNKGEFEHGVPSLSDPDDVYGIIQSAGRLKASEDYKGELQSVPGFFKGKNGKSLDQVAMDLADEYPHLGPVTEIKDKLVDTMSRYQQLKGEKKAKGERDARSAAEPMVTEITTGVPPSDVPISPTEWTVMGPMQRKSALEFFRETLTDESGRLDLAKMAKALHRFRAKFPMESVVLKERPNSPVIAEVERFNTSLTDWLQARAKLSWHRGAMKANPELMKDAEEVARREWLANGSTPAAARAAMRHFEPEIQASMRQRKVLFDQANRSRAYFGLQPVAEETGPYLPRKVIEGRDAVSLGGRGQLGVGHSLETSPGGHARERVFETYRQGEAAGMEYMDPRNAILLRDFDDLKIRATHQLFRNLEAKGTLFRTRGPAAAASPTGRPWAVENAPGGTWWATTEAEAKFLQQNLTEPRFGNFGSLVGYANQTLRNPNLIMPLPHIVKNMGIKYLLARGPSTPYVLARDAVEWARGSNPRLLREFDEAMPFAASGKSAHQILGEELRRGPVGEAVKRTLDTIGLLNRPSQKVIFQWADPAMRYSLFKHYREQGMPVYEAGNNAWIDLVRYGTRSQITDTWKSIPGNFFVPWRWGTITSLLKQAKNHPVRTALLLGAIDYAAEARYRADGRVTHYPFHYAEGPIAQILDHPTPGNVASILGTSAAFGPGGSYSVRQLEEALQVLQGKANPLEWQKLQRTFWGISQLYGLGSDFKKFQETGDTKHLAEMLGTAILGERNAYNYEPHRLARGLPESSPGLERSPVIREAERQQKQRQERFERSQERRQEHPRRTIEDRLRQSGYLR